MGRPTNGVPYLKGGVYHIRFKGDKDATSLDTKSENVARQRAKSVVRARGESGPPRRPAVSKPDVSPSEGPSSPIVGGGGYRPSVGIDTDPLADWVANASDFDGMDGAGDVTPNLPGSGGGERVQDPQPTGGGTALKPWEADAGKKGLTSEEKERMHSLLAGVVGRANVLAVGFAVRIFGRIPAEPTSDDTALLEKAWALQLNEWLADKEIKPAILIAAASAGLGIGMYVQGEPKPKKEVAPDGSQAKTAMGT